ncbi:fibronectin type III domain-containing protein [Streptomyces capillispiralis]|uniref:Fibronectin type III domain protein n=1 Tax=Streptomyces capillispiralis TaxID=68182 RepID=A0A561TQN8_9ACTN|nr:fibronectin type III domain protein [Streptomyces capillispiralis]GHH93599.1 hydrolase [Streptomyces capillispiralis]
MRGVPPAVFPRRLLALCGVLLLIVSCRWGGSDDAGGERPPGVPTGVTAEAGSATSVHVMWNAVTAADTRVSHYEVYRGSTKVKEVPGSEHMVDVTRLRPSTAYVFTVRARDTDGRLGPPSREVRATTPGAAAADATAPTRPAELRGRAAGSRAAQLSWSASTDDRGVVSYDVYQGGRKIHSVGGSGRAAVVTGLRPGTRYAFTVRARDAADNLSPPAATVRLTTAGGADGRATAPTGFRATSQWSDGAHHIALSWVPPRVDGVITEYEVRLDGRVATSLVYGGDAPRDRAAYRFYVGREDGVTHRVRIRAMLPDGTWGGFSAERTVTTGTRR